MNSKPTSSNGKPSVLTSLAVPVAVIVILFFVVPMFEYWDPRDRSLRNILATAEKVVVCNEGGRECGYATLPSDENPAALKALKATSDFHDVRRSGTVDYTLQFVVNEGRSWHGPLPPLFEYCSDTGEIGGGKERAVKGEKWATVPASFKIWMRSVRKRLKDKDRMLQ